MIRDAARELPPVRWNRPIGFSRLYAHNAECPLATSNDGIGPVCEIPICARVLFLIILRRDPIPPLTAFPILLFCIRCFNRQRLSRVAEGTGPLKPQQPGANAKVLIPAQVGRDKILD
jgi:hypothetical protein